MSTLCFHSKNGRNDIPGTEWYWFNNLCRKMLIAILDLKNDDENRPHPFRKAFPAGHYTHSYQGCEWTKTAETFVMVADSDFQITVGSRKTSLPTAALNTALALGGDQLKLAARICGQCEIHAFVEGPNRAWLASIMELGVQQGGIFRNVNWEKVIEFLKSSSDGPVVMSTSICEAFPNEIIAMTEGTWSKPETTEEEEDSEDYEDPWYSMPEDEKWRLAMEALRIRNARGFKVELKPDNWNNFYFGSGVDAFDIMDYFSSLPR